MFNLTQWENSEHMTVELRKKNTHKKDGGFVQVRSKVPCQLGYIHESCQEGQDNRVYKLMPNKYFQTI